MTLSAYSLLHSPMSLRDAIYKGAAAVARQTTEALSLLLEVYDIAWQIADELTAVAGACDYDEAPDVSNRLALIASCLPSVLNVQNAVLGGFYFNAAPGLRQIMEANARIAELRDGQQHTRNRTPNVSSLPLRLSQSYGPLSAISHSTALDSG